MLKPSRDTPLQHRTLPSTWEAPSNPPSGEIVWRQLHPHAITDAYSYVMQSQLP